MTNESTDFSKIIKKKNELNNEKLEKKKQNNKVNKNSQKSDDSQQSDSTKEVNVTFKARKDWRIHWMSAIKSEDTTLREVVTQALIERYGLPEDKDKS